METISEYGAKQYKSCVKCNWTGPLSDFSGTATLISCIRKVECPMCGKLQDAAEGVFAAGEALLPNNFTVVSGGQTGVDRGALDAAIILGLPHRGWCPKGRKAEDGVIPQKYKMQEMADTRYWKRTEQNVLDSDGTLVFPGNCESKGTALTIRLAKKHGRPLAVVPLGDSNAAETAAAWLAANSIRVLNVAGPRESGAPGICNETRKFLQKVLGMMENNQV